MFERNSDAAKDLFEVFRRHGGRLEAARRAFPAAPLPWIDLSTGVNPHARRASPGDAARLPDPTETAALESAAAAFGMAARALLFFASLFLTAQAQAAPRRVVSMNPCLDVILVNVADHGQIAALSHYARDKDTSTIAQIAETLPSTHESAEEVMAFEPDLVLTSRHSDLATRNALNRLKIRTELFSEPQNVPESLEGVRRVAALVGQEQRGEQVVARIEAALAAAAPRPGMEPIPALIFQSNGFTSGRGTLVDEMLARTGFVNIADRYGITWWANVSLEHVLADPPAILLAGEFRPDVPTWADRVLRHPALRAMEPKMKRAVFPDRLLYCGGPVLIQSAAALRRARHAVTGDAP